MKVKTVVISLAVTGALVAGGIYGAYYVLQSRKSPVEVVPVANVNSGYWGTTNTIYGTVTSQVAQNVTLDEEYAVDEIYVEAGQEVKEGDMEQAKAGVFYIPQNYKVCYTNSRVGRCAKRSAGQPGRAGERSEK